MKQVHIFKAGTHTSASGATLSFSEDDLAATVAAYDPKVHEAPIVIGHPKDNGPAYGWVKALDFREGVLIAEPDQVEPQFAEMVKAGRFKKRSASFYHPDAKNNPVPGVFYLRHVGFLGAAAPAVKGMKEVEFAADDDGVVEFTDDWFVTSLIARLFSGMRDWLLAEHGLEKADAVLPKYAIEDLNQAARDAMNKPEPLQPSPSFTEEHTMTPEQIAELQTKAARVDALEAANAKLTADFTELRSKVDSAEKAAALAGIKDAINVHVKAGRVLPAEVDQLADFAASLDDAAATFDFTDGDKTEKVSARALFLAQLAKRPVAVDFKERAGNEPDPADPVVAAQRAVMDQVTGKAAK